MTKIYAVIFEIFVRAEDEDEAQRKAHWKIMYNRKYDMMHTKEIPPGSNQITIVQDICLELEDRENEDDC